MKTAVAFLCLIAVCVAAPDTRIINGDNAALYSHPHQASLQYRPFFGSWSHICGAVLISNNKLVTAAHCLDGMSVSRLRIVVGALRLDQVSAYQQTVSIQRYTMHPGYKSNEAGFPNDIATIYLSSAVTFNTNVQPAELAPIGSSFEDEECVISGWGRYDPDTNNGAIHLQEVPMRKISNSECANIWGSSINNNHICILSDNADALGSACNGDSGGPLMCGPSKEYLAGVTSWGASTCDGKTPSVYTRTSQYNDWIAAN